MCAGVVKARLKPAPICRMPCQATSEPVQLRSSSLAPLVARWLSRSWCPAREPCDARPKYRVARAVRERGYMPDKTLIAIATTTAQESVERAAMMSSEHAGCTFAPPPPPMFWTAQK
jgi:hypothetical protein